MIFDQADFQVRCEWGAEGLRELAPVSDVVILVDILSFTTAVDIATARGAVIFPFPLKDASASRYANSIAATLASPDRSQGFSLSPASLQGLPSGYRLVLPSPNGAALAYSANHPSVLAACLRNATAVARTAARLGSTIALIPAGEMWPGGALRPALEDLIGAGAVISALPGSRSPEATLAAVAFEQFRGELLHAIRASGSGQELMERSSAADLELAAELDVSDNVPRLVNRMFASFG